MTGLRSRGWAIVSVLTLIGVALASQYFASTSVEEPRSASPAPLGSDLKSADDGHRSRGSTTEVGMPTGNWKESLLRIYANFTRHRIMALAAGMTYYSLLAIFPAIAALVAVYGLFSDPSTIARHLDVLGGFLPGSAIDIAREQLTRVAAKGSHTLGLTFLAGLGISLWSANAAMKALFDTLNIVHGEEEKRGFVRLNAISLGFTIVGVLFVIAALGAIVVIPVVLDDIGLSDRGDLLLRAGRWWALFLALTFALAIIYRYGPSRVVPRWRWISSGSAIAALLWLGVSALFSWYAGSFGRFNETYGSLGAVIGFMTWLWISAIVVLLGAEIDAEMEHQAARATATASAPRRGIPRPV